MRYIKKMEVANLWGRENISIEFESDVTVFTGLNGAGKSTLLSILFAVANTNSCYKQVVLSAHRYWAAKLTFNDGSNAALACFPYIENKPEDAINKEAENFDSIFNMDFINKIKKINSEDELNSLFRIIKDNKEDRGIITIEDPTKSTEKFSTFLYQEDRMLSQIYFEKDPENFDDLPENIKFYFGTPLDRSLRVLINKFHAYESKKDKDMIHELMESLKGIKSNNKRQKSIMEFIENRASSQKIGLDFFTGIIQDFFNDVHKSIDRDENQKIAFKLSNGEIIPWYHLSRGEKVLLVLLLSVFLLRDTCNLFLFDEPEIALHMNWQVKLISTFKKIAPKAQFIIATHSPSIIMDGWIDKSVIIEI